MAFSHAPITCRITANSEDGKSSFHPTPSSHAPSDSYGPMLYTYIYSTPPSPNPLCLSHNADLAHYTTAMASYPLPMYPPPGSTSAAILDFAPNPAGDGGICIVPKRSIICSLWLERWS